MFAYENKDGLNEVTITGYELHEIARQLTGFYRQTLHPSNERVQSITVRALPKKG